MRHKGLDHAQDRNKQTRLAQINLKARLTVMLLHWKVFGHYRTISEKI